MRLLELRAQRILERGGQHHDAVLAALAFAHDDRAAVEVDVLHAQAQRLGQAHAGAVEQAAEERRGRHPIPGHADQRIQHAHDLVLRQHDGQARLPLRTADLVHPGQSLAQHLLVEEQQRRQRLLVRRRRDTALGGQPAQKGLDLRTRQLGRMTQAVKTDEGTHPMHIGLFGAQAVVHVADLGAQEVEEARRRRGPGHRLGSEQATHGRKRAGTRMKLYIHTVSALTAARKAACRTTASRETRRRPRSVRR